MKRLTLLIQLIIFSFCSSLIAGDAVFQWAPTGYNISFPEGTTSKTIYKVLKDKHGFIWVSTSNGVERYDGMTFRHYHLGKSKMRTINYGFMVYITKDEQDNIWAYTERSVVNRYNPVKDEFEEVLSLTEKNMEGSIRGLYSNGKELFVGFTNNLVRWNIEQDSIVAVYPTDTEIRCLEKYDDQHILVGNTQGLWMIDLAANTSELICCEGKDVNCIKYDALHKLIWIGYRGLGLHYIQEGDWKNITPVVKGDNNIINAITALNDSVMLCGTDGSGLWACFVEKDKDGRYVPGRRVLIASESLTAPCQTPNSVVDDILVDDGNIWITMDLSGLAMLQPRAAVSTMVNPIAPAYSDRNALDVSVDKDGRYWIAYPRCLVCYEKSDSEPKIYMDDVSGYLTILAAQDGTVWTGGYNAGLYHLDPKTGKYRFFPSVVGSPVLDCVYALAEDSYHDIWVGGLNFGLTRLHELPDGEYEHTTFPDINLVTDIRTIGKDSIAVGTFGGIWIVDARTGNSEKLLADRETWPYTNSVASLVVVGDEIWFGTMGAGLACYNVKTKKAELCAQNNSLPSYEIRGIEMLNDSVLCASTEKSGIFAYDIRNQSLIHTIRHIDGQVMGIFSRSSSGASDGRIAFGSDNGVIAIGTHDIVSRRDSFCIFVNGDGIVDDYLHLPASSRNLDLQFTTNDVYDQSEYHFEYFIEGLTNDWEPMDENRRMRYLSLPPGDYKIKVRSYNATNLIDEKDLTVEVDCEWWMRWYFLLFYALAAIALIWFIAYHYRIKHISETDGLTGINNRYSGQKNISDQLQNHNRGVFVLLDCDKFKMVNDTYGHMVGDKLLIRVARALKSTFPNDIIMRLGGDEFAFYLAGTYTPEKIQEKADQLIRTVEEIRIGEMGDYVPSISMGAAFYNGKSRMTFEQLYTEADRRLYESKKHTGCWITVK